MNNLINENVVEKVKIRDILLTLKNIIAENKSDENEKITDKKLQEVYKVEKEIGATDSIAKLTKELEMQETPKKKRTTRNLNKVTKINNPVKENIIAINNEERQEERQD